MVPPYERNSPKGVDEQAEKNVGWNPRSGFHLVQQLCKLSVESSKGRAPFDGSTLLRKQPCRL